MKFSKPVVGTLVAALVLIAAGFLLVYPGGRGLVGDFRLVKGAGGTSYQLDDTRQPENQLGNQGAVVRIGWDAHHIVVLRASPSSPYGFAAGWMLIDVDGGKYSGPLTAEQLRQRPDAAHIVSYRADSAWAKLNGH